MEPLFLFISLVLLALNAMSQQKNNYLITGELTRDSLRYSPQAISKLYLAKKTTDGTEILIDSATVKNKKFRFEGEAPREAEMVIVKGFDNGTLSLFLESGNISILPFDGHFPVSAKVKGSPNNDILYGYQLLNEKLVAQVRNNYDGIIAGLPDSVRNNEPLLAAYQSALFAQNTLMMKTEIMKYVKQHIHTLAGLNIMRYDFFPMFSPKAAERQLLRSVPENMHTHPIYKEMSNLIKAANLAVGEQIPDIEGKTPQGKTIQISDLKGKYVLLDVWASWCGPCRREFPFLKEAMKTSENYNNFVILSYSLDDVEKDWQKAIEKNQLMHPNWIHISTLKGWNSDVVELLNIKGVPYTVLVNPQGKVISFDLRGDEMLKKVTRIMKGEESYE